MKKGLLLILMTFFAMSSMKAQLSLGGGVLLTNNTAVEFKADNTSGIMCLDDLETPKTQAFYLVDNNNSNLYICHFADSNNYQTVAEGQAYSYTDLQITETPITNIYSRGDYCWILTHSAIYVYEKEYTNGKHKLTLVTRMDTGDAQNEYYYCIGNGDGMNYYTILGASKKIKKYHIGVS